MSLLKDFKPALLFLGKFLGIYLVGNVLYGIYISHYNPKADPVSRVVTSQTSACLNLAGENTTYQQHPFKNSVELLQNGNTVLSVFEGCNGLNVMIIFVAFVVAFNGPVSRMLWFIPAGLIVIHLVNLGRIGLLYFVAQEYEQYFYYVHKYFFTAILYLVVFALWAAWVSLPRRQQAGR